MSTIIDEATQAQIREARGKFVSMAATYGLGVLNDSFFRQAAMLLAVAGGMPKMQGKIMANTIDALLTALFLIACAPYFIDIRGTETLRRKHYR